MSKKAIIIFSIWTSFWSALLNYLYTAYFNFGVPWIMFVCLAIYFALNCAPKDGPSLLASAYVGLIWGQVDFLLIALFTGKLGLNTDLSSFLAIVVGTAVSMYIHVAMLGNTPLRHMPFIFAGVCLTFSQGGDNIIGLAVTFFAGILLAVICSVGQRWAMAKFPLNQN